MYAYSCSLSFLSLSPFPFFLLLRVFRDSSGLSLARFLYQFGRVHDEPAVCTRLHVRSTLRAVCVDCPCFKHGHTSGSGARAQRVFAFVCALD